MWWANSRPGSWNGCSRGTCSYRTQTVLPATCGWKRRAICLRQTDLSSDRCLRGLRVQGAVTFFQKLSCCVWHSSGYGSVGWQGALVGTVAGLKSDLADVLAAPGGKGNQSGFDPELAAGFGSF